MKSINQTVQKTPRPIKILQYGEGNFLRGFAEYMVDIANEKAVFDGSVQIVKAVPFGSVAPLSEQDCVYTVLLRGIQKGEPYVEKRIITCVEDAVDAYEEYERYAAFAKKAELRFIISNTTEAGIVYDPNDDMALNPPISYPGKLTKFLHTRFTHFNGQKEKGLIILPVELIENNGGKLKEYCLKTARSWDLPEEFCAWLSECNMFCNTLVDRIVVGYPKDEICELEKELDYRDNVLVAGEPFALWVIESAEPQKLAHEFPLDKAGLPVIFTDNLKPYRDRKVRILNAAHTSSALAAYLCGLDTVGEMMGDKTMRAFLEGAVYEELAPTVELPSDEVKQFADSVMERFENPFIKHSLFSISLNSVSKFTARVLPSIMDTHDKTGTLPKMLCFSLAALIEFYSAGKRNDEKYTVLDDKAVLDFFTDNKDMPGDEFVGLLLKRTDFWGRDLSLIPHLCETVAEHLENIRAKEMRAAVEAVLQ